MTPDPTPYSKSKEGCEKRIKKKQVCTNLAVLNQHYFETCCRFVVFVSCFARNLQCVWLARVRTSHACGQRERAGGASQRAARLRVKVEQHAARVPLAPVPGTPPHAACRRRLPRLPLQPAGAHWLLLGCRHANHDQLQRQQVQRRG